MTYDENFCVACDRALMAYSALVETDRTAALAALQAYDAHREAAPHRGGRPPQVRT